MTDRPIIFSAPMIHALLDGRKTQTRRILKPRKKWRDRGYTHLDMEVLVDELWWWDGLRDNIGASAPIPYAPGDRLWVREAVRFDARHDVVEPLGAHGLVWYEADGPVNWPEREGSPGKLRPSIHMPRWASRLTLTVTDVRVQRLQDISEDDMRAEGMHGNAGGAWGCEGLVEDFTDLWDTIHGEGAWDRNDWVAAITFTVARRNIDA